jgi:hypothetical protein
MIIRLWKRLFDAWQIARDPVAFARSRGMVVGERCRFIKPNTIAFGSEPYLVRLGNHVTVCAGVHFITHDGGVWVLREQHPDIDVFGPITVGNNVFIGPNTLILPGATIGDNCIIGAGSVVTRNIPSNSVAVGIPARVIKSLDEYWAKVEPNATYIRSLPADEKRRILEEKFWGKTAAGAK